MVHTTLPNQRSFNQGVEDTLYLLKIAGIGAQLIREGISDPKAIQEKSLELIDRLKELPLEANEAISDVVVDPLAELLGRIHHPQ